MEMAKTDGKYETFDGSPASQGLLQFDLWCVESHSNERYDWTGLKEQIKTHGLRNSLLLAPMPTASTSQILGFNECFEPITSNIYTRRTLAGEFIITNKYLMKELINLGIWNDQIKNHIIANNGSIQSIPSIPNEIKEKYKTVWEIPMKALIDMSADRGIYICQSQSLNLWLEDPNYNSLTAMHFYGWGKRSFMTDVNGQVIIPKDDTTTIVYDKEGNPKFYRDTKTNLKTGMYYLRTKSAADAVKFTVQKEEIAVKTQDEMLSEISCSLDDPDSCIACGS
jgi:ribonucleoside-diphosphate reductase alpha chain